MFYKFQDIETTIDDILAKFGEALYVYFTINPGTGYLLPNFTRRFKEFEEAEQVHRTMYVIYIEELLFNMNPDKSKREGIAAWLRHIEKYFNVLRTLPVELQAPK